jgi:RNA polymerase sigma-70 factor (ECF subfamily)
MADPSLREELLATIPSLRAFALSLTGNGDRADDLVQDTIVKALGNLHGFREGTNLQAWLFTILRNHFYSEHRKRRREVEDVDGAHAATLITIPDQDARLSVVDFQKALLQLPGDQREALLLVGAQGFSYEEAAAICGCAMGTIKSRISRARTRLAELLRMNDAEDLGPDGIVMAALHRQSNSDPPPAIPLVEWNPGFPAGS